MSEINKVFLVGHMGKDPDLRYLTGNVAVCSFPLATTEYIIKNNVRTEETEWHNVVMWRTIAETAARQLAKGKLVLIEGKCHTRSFKTRDGGKKYITEIVADSFTLLGGPIDTKLTPEIREDINNDFKP